MKVQFIQYNHTFKSNSIPKLPKEGIITGYDDYVSSDWRDIMRKNLEDRARLSYYDYYELPKSDYEMESMIKSWGLKVDHISKKIIVPKYLNTISLVNNNFRGALPSNNQYYEDLKKSGITTIIAAANNSYTKEFAENNGLEYIGLYANNSIKIIGSIFDDVAFCNEDEYMKYYKDDDYNNGCNLSGKELIQKKKTDFETKNREFIENLIKSVSAWQKGCCFIGCTMGTAQTSDAISLIDAFNPKSNGNASDYLSADQTFSIGILYKKLTSQDKKLMGWTKEFEQSFRKRFVHI